MGAPHAFLTYTVKDAKGKTSPITINFPANVDIGQVASFAVDTATMINNFIKGKIVNAGIGLMVDISGATIRATPDPNSDVEEGARFSFKSALGVLTNMRIPTFDEAQIVSGTQQVDAGNATVDPFVQRIISGKTTGLVNASPSDDHGSDIVSLEAARENFSSTRY
jgi:hypothetical protein